MSRTREFNEKAALQRAMHTFWSKGFEATSLSDLTEAMGIAKSSLYAAFGDKEKLFARALDLYLEEISSERIEILRTARTAAQGIRAFLEHHIRVALDPRTPPGCLFVNSAVETDLLAEATAGHVASRAKLGEAAIRDLLERAQQTGEISRSTDVRALALMIASISYGIHVMARMHADKRKLQAVADITLQSLI